MKSKWTRTKNILLLILLVVLLGVSIIIVPYFIPNTPKFTLRKNYQAITSNDSKTLSQCSIFDFDTQKDATEHKEYLIFSSKMNLSQEELEAELYLIKKLDREKFDYLGTKDIVKYKVGVYIDTTLLSQPQSTVTLIKNNFDKDKFKWVTVP